MVLGGGVKRGAQRGGELTFVDMISVLEFFGSQSIAYTELMTLIECTLGSSELSTSHIQTLPSREAVAN